VTGELQAIEVRGRTLAAYAPVAGEGQISRIRRLAAPLAGMRVLHLSMAAGGGRVPELLHAVLPLARDVGIEVDWRVLFGGAELHEAAMALQDGLQGAETALDDAVFSAYLTGCEDAVRALPGEYEAIVLHDPGSLGAAAALPDQQLVWRCHVDAGQVDPAAGARARPLLERCGAFVVPLEEFATPGVPAELVRSIPPGIDPLSARNLELAPLIAGRLVRALGADLSRPLCCQVLRFDRWKDPHAAIEAFELAKRELPDLQLVVAGALESDGGAAWSVVKEVTDYAADQPDLHVLTSYAGLGNLELGALQRLARVALQSSIREGFGLAASEALWKGTPVIGGRDGGVPLQVRDGIEGYLADSPDETAARIVELVRDPGLAVEMGRAGRERVRDRFLVTRVLEDELRLLAEVRSGAAATVDRR
jgi:trehalose synthase